MKKNLKKTVILFHRKKNCIEKTELYAYLNASDIKCTSFNDKCASISSSVG